MNTTQQQSPPRSIFARRKDSNFNTPSGTSLLLRVPIVLIVLAGAAFAGWSPSVILLGLPIVIVGVVLLWKRPQIGFIGLIVGSLVIPFSVGTGSESKVHAGMLMLIGMLFLWIVEGIIHRSLMVHANPTTVPLILFLTVVVISFFTGQLTWFPKVDSAPIRAQLGGLGLFFLSAAAFWLAAFRIRKVVWLQNMVWVFLIVGSLWVVGQLFSPLRRTVDFLFEHNSSGATGSVFWVWMIALAFGQAVLNKQLPAFVRVILMGLVGASLYLCMIVNRDWTSGWLPALVAIGMIVWFGFPKLRYATLLVGSGLALSRAAPVLEKLVLTKDNDYSLVTRLAAANTMWQLILHNPVLGFGPANYYFYTPLFSILGYNNIRFNSHNNYVDLVAETGFLGLAAFFWFAWRAGRYVSSVKERMPAGFARAYAISALAGWIGTLASGFLGDWFLPFVYNLGFYGFRSSVLAWLFLGGVIALDRLLSSSEEQTPATNIADDAIAPI